MIPLMLLIMMKQTKIDVMNKKITLGIFALSLVVACSEVCDHDIIKGPYPPDETIYDYLEGTWYEEPENEEVRYTKSGTLYDKYCTVNRSGETEGRFEADQDNMRLTYSYEFMGQMMFTDWKISDMTDFSFTISSDMVGQHKLEKVVETVSLEVGDSCSLAFFKNNTEYKLVSMESSSRIVSIDKNTHKITSCGEKGSAYIKLNTDKGTAWAKVIVGDDCLDLWYDYVSFIGKDYNYMKSILGTPSVNGEDGYSFGYSMLMHDLIAEVDFFMNKTTGLIEEIALVLINAAPAAQIQSYMKAHYYPTDEVGNGEYYTTSPVLSESVALVSYNKTQSIVWISDATLYVLPDYSEDLGKTEDEIVAKYGELYYGILPLYEVTNYYGYSIFFQLSETTGKVTAAQFSLMPEHDVDSVHGILSSRYNHYKTDETNTKYAYRNAGEKDSTIMVVYDAENDTVTWFDSVNYGK